MIVELREETGVAVIEPAGKLDARSAGFVRQRLKTLIEGGRPCVVVDMHRVDFVDSAGLAALVSSLKLARTRAGELRLAALQEPVRLIFEITRLHHAFDIHEELADAVHAFEQTSVNIAAEAPIDQTLSA